MPPTYKIHPGIGIARLGNSPQEFCISPEKPAALPICCDECGNPLLAPDGQSELPIKTFKDAKGRIKRQAARFQVYVYDDQNPAGRPLKLGDRIQGGGNGGTLVDIRWRVYLANKKAVWYEFKQLEGEHGYSPDHPRRNSEITDSSARQKLIIDPGPRVVNTKDRRHASFGRDNDRYAPNFPPELKPHSIDTLGDLKTDDTGRLLVLGGHGHSGSYKFDEFGQPRITSYANNDGWFDDTSDGPVMARLVMFADNVSRLRYVDVEFPAWVIVGYPAYVPEILDMVTLEDVQEDLATRQFAFRTDLYGEADTFDKPQRIAPTDTKALIHWRAGRLTWNPRHKPWFYRDIWPILFRPDEFTYLTNVLAQSNYPHNQSPRGTFDPQKLAIPPSVNWREVKKCEQQCIRKNQTGELLLETMYPVLSMLDNHARLPKALGALLFGKFKQNIQRVASEFAGDLHAEAAAEEDIGVYEKKWQVVSDEKAGDYADKKRQLEVSVDKIINTVVETAEAEMSGGAKDSFEQLASTVRLSLEKFHSGRLLREWKHKCLEKYTYDPYRRYRQFLYNLLRLPGEENTFSLKGRPHNRNENQPLMPLLNGDNPISNTLPSKFFRLTDYQLYLLGQWAKGLFFNEEMEGWVEDKPDPFNPYAGWINKTGRDVDRGVLTNALGGAFCPGGEVNWIIRNPSIYREPYRINADPNFYSFRQTAAQASYRPSVSDEDYVSYVGINLSQDSDFDRGLQPGDLTKYMAVPWQADFNECSTQPVNVTYEEWNNIYPSSEGDSLLKRETQVWETLWWPAHRPLQTIEVTSLSGGKPAYQMLDWTRGIPGTNAGDQKMVSAWSELGFVIRNPYLDPSKIQQPSPDQKYISVERNEKECT